MLTSRELEVAGDLFAIEISSYCREYSYAAPQGSCCTNCRGQPGCRPWVKQARAAALVRQAAWWCRGGSELPLRFDNRHRGAWASGTGYVVARALRPWGCL